MIRDPETPEESGASWLPLPEELSDMGPSRSLIYAMVHEMDGLNGKDIQRYGSLSPGTVYPALKELEELGFIKGYQQFACGGKRWTVVDEDEEEEERPRVLEIIEEHEQRV